MLQISNIFLPPDFDFSNVSNFCAEYLNINENEIEKAFIHKRSIDARNKSKVKFLCSFRVEAQNEERFLNLKGVSKVHDTSYIITEEEITKKANVIIVGLGPAGLFAALTLSRRGLNPIVIERGSDVDKRIKDVNAFNLTGKLNTKSNIQFGEGGAGTFSDGKLTTGIKDKRCGAVLREFHKNGAPECILYDAKPHIGTDILPKVIKNIRQEITRNGGKVLFDTKLSDIGIKNGKISSAYIEDANGISELPCDYLILSIGHSARDTFNMLYEKGIKMEAKPFAIGARIEHSQSIINKAQLGSFAKYNQLLPADYKLFTHLSNGRGVYTFCMCPGGSVVNASSEECGIATNGMSRFARDGLNANSALLVGITPEDYGTNHALAGIYFQQDIERRAYNISGGYKAPAQTVGDFLAKKPSTNCGKVKPTFLPAVHYCSIDQCLPSFITDAMREGIKVFDRKLHGFADPDAILTAPETRSSSPVRIIRDESYEASLKGVIPCGEGAGYAGGIMSAAVDGIRCAEAVINKL